MNAFLRYLSYILWLSAIFLLIPLFAAAYYDEPISGFLASMTITLALGIALFVLSGIGKYQPLTIARAILLTAVSFIVVPLISSITFLPYTSWINAFFESVSGFTTTGLSIFPSIQNLPKSLILWRATSQWLGGFGIIIVFLFIFSRVRVQNYSETKVSIANSLFTTQGLGDKMEPTFRQSTLHLVIIYASYTFIGIILLSLAGLSTFESTVISFGSISTGGFAATDTFYTDSLQLSIISLLMILGSVSFAMHNKLIQRKFQEFFRNTETRWFFVILLSLILLSLLTYRDFGVVVFHLTSALATAGYATTPIGELPLHFILLIIIAMVIGGSMASTAGGLKIRRLLVLLSSIGWAVKKISLPSTAIVSFRMNKKNLNADYVFITQVFFFTYVLLLFVGIMVFLMLGYSLLDSSFQVTSALGTVGLSTMPLDAVPAIGKFALIVLMFLGRLEIFPVFLLVARLFNKDM